MTVFTAPHYFSDFFTYYKTYSFSLKFMPLVVFKTMLTLESSFRIILFIWLWCYTISCTETLLFKVLLLSLPILNLFPQTANIYIQKKKQLVLYCFLLTNRTSWFSSPKLSEVPGFSSTSPLTHQFLCFDSLPLHEMTLIGINRNPINISEIFCLHLGQTLWANFTLGAMLPSASPTAFAEKPSLPLETLQAHQALHPTLHMLPAASCTFRT